MTFFTQKYANRVCSFNADIIQMLIEDVSSRSQENNLDQYWFEMCNSAVGDAKVSTRQIIYYF